MKESYLISVVVLIVAALFTLKIFSKDQICNNYFPEMNRVVCLFADLPGVPRER